MSFSTNSTKNLFLIIICALLLPNISFAQTTKTFTENFSSKSKIETTATFASIDTVNKEAFLPFHYTIKNLAKGLQNFTGNYVMAVGNDGNNLMVGGSKGALNLVNYDGSAEDISGLLAGKAAKINSISFSSSSGWWLVGGMAKQSSSGAMLFQLTPGGIAQRDLQAEAKSIKMTNVTDVSCLGAKCLIIGTPHKFAIFDGTQLQELPALEELKLIDPVKIANNGLVWLILGSQKNPSSAGGMPYRVAVYSFDGDNIQTVSLSETANSSGSTYQNVGWDGSNWLIVKGKPKFNIWQLNSGSAQDITSQFSPLIDKLNFGPIIGSDSKTWFIGGGSQWKGLIAKNDAILTKLDSVIPELKNANILSMIKTPMNGIILGGSSMAAPLLINLELTDYTTSAAIQSTKITSSGSQVFKNAKIDADATLPPGTGIDYMLATGINSWESFTIGQLKDFRRQGKDLYWRAVLYSNDAKITPRLRKVTITYSTGTPDSPAIIKTRDAKRLNEIKQVATAIKAFLKARGVYPMVDGLDAGVRWKQLSNLLIDGKFITKMPNDPLHEKDSERQYDYFSNSVGTQYVLRATLEDPANKSLTKDLDGMPMQIFYTSYTCDDPVYCEGYAPAQQTSPTSPPTTPPQPSTLPAGKVEIQILKDPQGKVWKITNNKKLPIPSRELVEQLGYIWSKVKQTTMTELAKYQTARLLQIKNQSEIYYLSSDNLKRHIPDWQTFVSYGFKLTDVLEVKPEELRTFGNNILIKLQNDKRVWKLEGGVKHLIPNPSTFEKYGFKWQDIANINWTEFNAYTEGTPLQ